MPTLEWFYVNTTYYLLTIALLCWLGTHLAAARALRRETVVRWFEANWPGVVMACVVTLVAGLAVEPALRVLSDEANLVGTSKNLFASKSATFTVSGKYYYGSYWDIDVAIDQRPALFPYLVSLVHAVCGYSYRNAFVFNLLVLPAFVLTAYRLAKSLGGESFALVVSLLVVAHPITLISLRSGGFDFFACFWGLFTLKSWLDYCREQSPLKLALLWLNLCLYAEIRYESALFVPLVLLLLLVFKLLTWQSLRPHAFVYALTPVYLLPRLCQAILLGSVPEQMPGVASVSVDNFFANAREYLKPLWSPFESSPAHCAVLIGLGLVGSVGWLRWLTARVRARDLEAPLVRFGIGVGAWVLLQAVITFSYVWGRAQYPSSARLMLPLDTFVAFAAAWVLTRVLQRWQPFVAVLVAAALFVSQVPAASRHRMLNRLTQTRESAATWRFFEQLHEKRILIVTDRPNLFTIMDYGAMSFESARRDTHLFTAFARHLFLDVYVIQQLKLSTNQPLPGYEIWPTRELHPVLEFQNDADVLVRISRLAR